MIGVAVSFPGACTGCTSGRCGGNAGATIATVYNYRISVNVRNLDGGDPLPLTSEAAVFRGERRCWSP